MDHEEKAKTYVSEAKQKAKDMKEHADKVVQQVKTVYEIVEQKMKENTKETKKLEEINEKLRKTYEKIEKSLKVLAEEGIKISEFNAHTFAQINHNMNKGILKPTDMAKLMGAHFRGGLSGETLQNAEKTGKEITEFVEELKEFVALLRQQHEVSKEVSFMDDENLKKLVPEFETTINFIEGFVNEEKQSARAEEILAELQNE